MKLAEEQVAGRETADTVADAFLDCLARARHEWYPYDHWLLEDALPSGACEAIAALPVALPENAVFDGRRATNNAERVYFTPENQLRFPVCRHIADGFKQQRVKTAIEAATGTNLKGGQLRIEYCQDAPGFWLEPHTDISAKLFTMLVYLLDDPALAPGGTDILRGPPDHGYVGSAPCARNKGVVFIPGDDTWHGAGHNRVEAVRKSIIINYVTPDWRETWELA